MAFVAAFASFVIGSVEAAVESSVVAAATTAEATVVGAVEDFTATVTSRAISSFNNAVGSDLINSTVEDFATQRVSRYAGNVARRNLKRSIKAISGGLLPEYNLNGQRRKSIRVKKGDRSFGNTIYQFRESNTMPFTRYRRRRAYRRRRGKGYVTNPGDPSITKTHVSTFMPLLVSPKVGIMTSDNKLFPSILNFVKPGHSPDVMASGSVLHSYFFPSCHVESLPELCGLAYYVRAFDTTVVASQISSQTVTKYVKLDTSPLECRISSIRVDCSVTFPVTLPVVNARFVCGLFPLGNFPNIPKPDAGNENIFLAFSTAYLTGEKIEYTLPKFYGNLGRKKPGFIKLCSRPLNIGSPVLFSGAAPAYQKCERRTFIFGLRGHRLYFRSLADMYRVSPEPGPGIGYGGDTIFTTLSPNGLTCYALVLSIVCDKLFEPHENVISGNVIPQHDKARFAFAAQPALTTRFKFLPSVKPLDRFNDISDNTVNFGQDGGSSPSMVNAATRFAHNLFQHHMNSAREFTQGFFNDPPALPADNTEVKMEE